MSNRHRTRRSARGIKLLNDNHERLLHRSMTLESVSCAMSALEQGGFVSSSARGPAMGEMLITRSFDRLNDRMDRV